VFKDMPLYPFARTLILKASNILVLAGLRGLPTPAACDLIMLYCKSSSFSTGMSTVAKLPMPVVTPYTEWLSSKKVSTKERDLSTLLIASFDS
jgi:hypothetical protein